MAPHFPMRGVIAATFLFATSCQTIFTDVTYWPTFNEAAAISGPATPATVLEEEVDASNLPLLVPYAAVHARSVQVSSREALSRAITRKAETITVIPDLIVMGYASTRNTGMVHHGYGIFTYTSASDAMAVLYRMAPSKLDFETDERTVISVAEGGHAEKAGITEGDTIVSINGLAVRRTESSGLSQLALKTQIGTEVRVIWLRPGQGRMEAMIPTVATPPKGLPALQEKARKKKRAEQARSTYTPNW